MPISQPVMRMDKSLSNRVIAPTLVFFSWRVLFLAAIGDGLVFIVSLGSLSQFHPFDFLRHRPAFMDTTCVLLLRKR